MSGSELASPLLPMEQARYGSLGPDGKEPLPSSGSVNWAPPRVRRRTSVRVIRSGGVIGETMFRARATQRKVRRQLRASMRLEQSGERRPRGNHTWLYSMLNASSKKPQAVAYKYAMAIMILFDTFCFIISTVVSVQRRFKTEFYVLEGFVSSLFLVEYILRLVVVTQSRRYRDPRWGRLRYAMSLAAIIDLTSFLPFFIEIIFSRALPTLTYLRMFRLVRILKTESYAAACASAARVVRFNSEILVVAFLMCGILLLGTSTVLYYLRPGLGSQEDDMANFYSIPDCMYLAILMLTGQGVPDGVLPWYTKIIVVVTAVFSVALFTIPSSMLTWGFEAEAARLAKRRYLRLKARQRGEELTSSSDSSSVTTDNKSDDEYERIYADIESSDSGGNSVPKAPVAASAAAATAAERNKLDRRPSSVLLTSTGGGHILGQILKQLKTQTARIAALEAEISGLRKTVAGRDLR